MASISLLLDEDVRPLLAEILRTRGYDVVHVVDFDRESRTDEEQLAFAVLEQRVFLTHNVRDFALLDKTYRESAKEHFGIVLAKQMPLRDLLRRALKFLSNHDSESVRNNLLWLDD